MKDYNVDSKRLIINIPLSLTWYSK